MSFPYVRYVHIGKLLVSSQCVHSEYIDCIVICVLIINLPFWIGRRSEKIWKWFGKSNLAIRAPWPMIGEEDKILTRQALLLRDSMKKFRTQVVKAKKGWKQASILISDVYPQWKIDTLTWMQTQYQDGTFASTFIEDLKDWTATTVTDKKMIKLVMQFASFRKREVEEVGVTALDIQLPFNQKEIFIESQKYIKAQLAIEDLDIIMPNDSASSIPEKVLEQVEPGKPHLWCR